jgi:hypothetical protein
MRKLKSFGAYTWAALATLVVLATFVYIGPFSRAIVAATGVKVSPWYLGGDVVRETTHEGYRTVLRRPVFDGLIGQRSKGFVQVEWFPAEGATLPTSLREGIDYDNDGAPDFTVELDTVANRAIVTPLSPRVLGLERVYKTSPERVIRVSLLRR